MRRILNNDLNNYEIPIHLQNFFEEQKDYFIFYRKFGRVLKDVGSQKQSVTDRLKDLQS